MVVFTMIKKFAVIFLTTLTTVFFSACSNSQNDIFSSQSESQNSGENLDLANKLISFKAKNLGCTVDQLASRYNKSKNKPVSLLASIYNVSEEKCKEGLSLVIDNLSDEKRSSIVDLSLSLNVPSVAEFRDKLHFTVVDKETKEEKNCNLVPISNTDEHKNCIVDMLSKLDDPTYMQYYFSDTTDYYSKGKPAYPEEYAINFFNGKLKSSLNPKENCNFNFIIDCNNESIGLVSVKNPSKNGGNIGYVLKEKYSGHGIMGAAVKNTLEILEYLNNQNVFSFKLEKLHTTVRPENTASHKILLKNGFVTDNKIVENEYGKEIEYDYYFKSK